MSKKKLLKRLENLLVDLEQDVSILPVSGEQSVPGWTWECDSQGCFIACSSEVESILGIRPQEFIGQPLARFALRPAFRNLVENSLRKNASTVELDVQYTGSGGEPVSVKLHVFPLPQDGQEESGFRGFTQVIPEALSTVSLPADQPQPERIEKINEDSNLQNLETFEAWVEGPIQPLRSTCPESSKRRQVFSQPPGSEELASMTIPVKVENNVLGLLEVIDDNPDARWDKDERQLVEEVADQLEMALENARLIQAEQRRASELNTLAELSRLISQNLDLEEVYATAYRIIGQLIPTEAFFINLVDRQNNEFIAAYVVDKGLRQAVTHFPIHTGFSGYVYSNRQPFLVKDLEKEPPPFQRMQSPGSTDKVRSVIAVPLIFSGETIGVLSSQSYKPEAFDEYDLKLLQTFADHIAIAVQNARLFQQEQHRRQVADTLRDIARVLGSTLNLREVVERMLDQLAPLIEYNTASIQLVHKDRTRQLIGGRGFDVDAAIEGTQTYCRSASEEPLIYEVIQTKGPILISDTQLEKQWEFNTGTTLFRSWLAAPLIVGDEVIGILTLDSIKPGVYTQETIELASAVAAQAAIALQNARLFERSQETLAETETLYQASAELNTAQNYYEILDILRRHTIVGEGSHHVSLAFFDKTWTRDNSPEWINILARWTTNSSDTFIPRYSLTALPSLSKLLRSDQLLFIEDIENDPRLDENTRELYLDRFNAKSTLFVSIVASGQWLGFLNANYPEIRRLPEAGVRRLEALINQASVAVQNLHSIELAERRAKEAQQRSEELALINRVVSEVVSSPNLQTVLETMANELVSIFSIDHAGIALFNDDRTCLTVVAERSRQPGISSIGTLIPVKGNLSTERVIQTRKAIVIADAQTNPLLESIQDMMRRRDIQSIAILPIITSGEVIGTVGLEILEWGRKLKTQEIALAETLVGQISTAIQNANLFQQIQAALSETEALYRASAEMNSIQSYQDVLDILRRSTLLNHPETNHISLNLFDHAWAGEDIPESFTSIARWSRSPLMDIPTTPYLLKNWPAAGLLLNSNTPTVIQNTDSDARLDPVARSIYTDGKDTKSLILAPLNAGGDWIGYISASFSQSISFQELLIRRLTALAGQAGVAIQNLRLLDETRRRAAQLETAAIIARDTSGTLALESLLNRAVNLIRDRYGYYHASIFLTDETGLNAVIRESTGEAGEEMKRRGYKLTVGSRSIIGYVTELGKPLVINDVAQDPIHRPNPLLPETRAELGIPLKIGSRVI